MASFVFSSRLTNWVFPDCVGPHIKAVKGCCSLVSMTIFFFFSLISNLIVSVSFSSSVSFYLSLFCQDFNEPLSRRWWRFLSGPVWVAECSMFLLFSRAAVSLLCLWYSVPEQDDLQASLDVLLDNQDKDSFCVLLAYFPPLLTKF